MVDTQLRFVRAASLKEAPGSEPSHIHIVRPSRLRRLETADGTSEALAELISVPKPERDHEAA
jgi:hypothetical protein